MPEKVFWISAINNLMWLSDLKSAIARVRFGKRVKVKLIEVPLRDRRSLKMPFILVYYFVSESLWKNNKLSDRT